MALTRHPACYALLLFDVLFQSEILRNILLAVTRPAKQLILTAGLIGITIFAFALFALFHYPRAFPAFGGATDALAFFWTAVYDVMLPGVAMVIGSERGFERRFLFDLLFFVLISVILLNIIFGIIIDTFGALRDETQGREERLKTRCLICELPSADFEDENIGSGSFTGHLASEHNPWDYLFFIFYLKRKDPTTYTGFEQAVFEMLQDRDIGWLPHLRSLALESGEDVSKEEETQQSRDSARLAEIAEVVSNLDKRVESLTGTSMGIDRCHSNFSAYSSAALGSP